MRRYARTQPLGLGFQYGTSYAIPTIRQNVVAGNIRTQRLILGERDRLDILAGRFYGDAKLWWIIAAASNIGYGLQVPPGTIIFVPVLADVAQYVG